MRFEHRLYPWEACLIAASVPGCCPFLTLSRVARRVLHQAPCTNGRSPLACGRISMTTTATQNGGLRVSEETRNVSKAIESLLLVEGHLDQLEHHSAKQVKLLEDEREQFLKGADAAGVVIVNGQRLARLRGDVRTLKKAFSELRTESKDLKQETDLMFMESSDIICAAIEQLFKK